jgi:serine/threonine-protein kinase
LTVTSGTRLGAFEVLGPLGKGGMGEVYRARDTRLGREVAIKVLPEALAQDPERLARFEREARVLASLKHPNIATLHGFERSGDIGFLVMELIEGETLGDRIARGPIPWRQAATLFEAIAEALKAAHENGIVHRDLKPANMKLDAEGRPKVLDFGLALASFEDAAAVGLLSQSPTVTAQSTVAGVLLGTAAYMAPEQARGLRVDRRADVWAFGCCLYEALTGARAFDGADVSLILAAILSGEPDWQRLPAGLPREIDSLVRRCLEKDPRQRLQDLGDARWWLGEARRTHDERGTPTAAGAAGRRIAAASLIAGALLGAGGLWLGLRQRDADSGGTDVSSPSVRFEVRPRVSLAFDATFSRDFAVDPRGTAFAFSASSGEIYVHDLATAASRAIPDAWGRRPFFSDDGQWLGVEHEEAGGVRVVKFPSGGGVPQRLFELGFGEFSGGFAWQGDVIVFAIHQGPSRGLWRVSASGSTPRQRLGDDPRLSNGLHPSFVPSQDAVLFTGRDEDALDRQKLCVVDLSTGTVSDLGIEGRAPQYVTSGHLVWARNDGLWAARFDVETLRAIDEARLVAPLAAAATLAMPFVVSPGGTLVSVEPDSYDLVEMSFDGGRRVLPTAGGLLRFPRYSHDGRFVAYARGVKDTDRIWIRELATGRENGLLNSPGQSEPVWTPDGAVVYTDLSSSSFRLRLAFPDRRSEPVTLLESDDWLVPFSVSARGVLLFSSKRQIWHLDLARSGSAEVWSNEPVWDATFSPDGRWVAYFDDRDFQVFVRSYRDPGKARLASTEGCANIESKCGGWQPSWSKDGRTLYFANGDGLQAVPVRVVGDDLELGASHLIFPGFPTAWRRLYDPRPDGRAVVLTVGREAPTQFNVMINLGRELRQGDRRGAAGR